MIRRYELRVTLCIVLSLLMLVDFAIFNPAPAFALDKKSVAVGAGIGLAAGAGLVLAAPAIGGAVAAAGGVATAVVGGAAAATGGIVGVLAGVGGAIASALGAVGGFIAGIFASPLFIPALILVAVAVGGYLLYKRYKAKKGGNSASGPNQEVLPGSDEIYVTPGDYEMSGVIPGGDAAAPVSVGNDPVISLGGDAVTISSEPSSVSIPAQAPTTTSVTTTPGIPTSSDGLKAAHDRYIASYQKYTTLVTNSG
ncbi:MAG TPA: hypothetical protein DCG57_04190, partial [Candidatus Riflebacteria bacterium]|nr:hypothetical protein [Candidatus Riflebacteria bacterium]